MKAKSLFLLLATSMLLASCSGSGASSLTSEQSSDSSKATSSSASLSSEENTVTVTFDLGYDGKTFTQSVVKGEKASKPEDPVRPGYHFLDWVDENGDHWVFNGFVVTADITLYAVWSDPIDYAVRFVNDDQSLLYATTAHYGDTAVYVGDTPVAQIREAGFVYRFAGWDKEDLTIKEDTVFTARYDKSPAALTAYYYDYDDTLLATLYLDESEEPVYPYALPERQETFSFYYCFEEWKVTFRSDSEIRFKAVYDEATIGLVFDKNEVKEYTGYNEKVAIPEKWNGFPITKIGGHAFQHHERITSVSLPSSILTIEEYAFHGCGALSSIAMPDAITSIGAYAFKDCYSLTAIELPRSLNSLGRYAFDQCKALTSIVLPEGIQSVGDGAFFDCLAIDWVIVPKGIAYFGSAVFANLWNLVIYCGELSTPSDWRADWSCEAAVVFGYQSMASAGSFDYALVSSGGSESAIINAVKGAPNKITVPSSIDGHGVSAMRATMLGGVKGTLEKLVIEDGVSILGQARFEGFGSLREASIGNGVAKLDFEAFCHCAALTSVSISDSVTEIATDAFKGCSSLPFIALPRKLTAISRSMFYECTSLSSIVIPASVASIDSVAFYSCTSLETVFYGGDEASWNQIDINSFENGWLLAAKRYYYSETSPEAPGDYWHYADGLPTPW